MTKFPEVKTYLDNLEQKLFNSDKPESILERNYEILNEIYSYRTKMSKLLSFYRYKDPNKNDSCINGSGGLIAKLEPSKEFKKEIHLKGHKGHKFEGNANITVMFLDGNVNPFYQAHHKLGIIGNYK